MTGHWRARLQRRIGEEVQYIVDAFSAKGTNVGVETEGTGVGYLYAEGEVLVLEQHVVQVREILDRREPDQQPEEGEAQLAPFLAHHPDVAFDPIDAGEIAGLAGLVTRSGTLRTLPCHAFGDDPLFGGMDGFFAARFVRGSG